ncbi:hypothetical protein [Actinophytocola glycyrrhizae]|uniref:Sensor histidine kinase n=1 Tax=Actinophytocola glycyrrhizae TaxID=2044873 RepID=A0ABV9RVU7_9PSEU
MTVDILLRGLGILLTPLVTLLTFAVQDGRRRARLAKQAKTAAELISLAPPNSRTYRELVKHYELAVEEYLDAHRRWRWKWGSLTQALLLGVFGVWSASFGWVATLAPEDRPSWMWWTFEDDLGPRAWGGWLFVVLAVPFLVGAIRGLVDFLAGGRRSSRRLSSSLGQ